MDESFAEEPKEKKWRQSYRNSMEVNSKKN